MYNYMQELLHTFFVEPDTKIWIAKSPHVGRHWGIS